MDLLTDAFVYTLFFLYSIYSKILTKLSWLFLPVTKWYINRKFASFGLIVNGSRPIDPKILDDRAYTRVAADWNLGYFDAYAANEIHVDDPVGAGEVLFRTRRIMELEHPLSRVFTWFNLQTPNKAWEVGKEHYDLGTDLWEAMFGEHMQYSCGYWKNAKNLKEAQEAKLHLIAQKLKLKPGMRVLDIGCGWGGLARFLSKNYGVSVVGYTISAVQKKYCEKLCADLPVQIRLADYRTISEKFDRAVSVGMFEHVGVRNYEDYFKTVRNCLDDDGLFLLHTMGINHKSTPHNTIWVHQHIFRNGYFPYHLEIAQAIEDKFIIEDWHNMGHHYYLTYKAWEENLEKHWPTLEPRYGAKFRRIWTVYLHLFQALWRSRSAQLWQIVLSRDGIKGGYESVR